MPANGPDTRYFPVLTGVRTVAAAMVFFHHFNIFSPQIFGNFIYGFVSVFYVGVTIFFVLSGFLICYRYQHLVSLKKKWLKQYFINRFARIYPMYFLITIIYALPFICKCDFSNEFNILILNLTFLRGFFSDYRSTLITTGWSLTVEEMFYFLFPLIILFSGKIRLIFQPLIFLGVG
ncbi:MAG: acyltransferase, partial [Bacteroidota bacterium]|nr:acyltransferase [Bacteroidota bacterium]